VFQVLELEGALGHLLKMKPAPRGVPSFGIRERTWASAQDEAGAKKYSKFWN
jgi:hypothetical protein